jgi:VCBS repeat-containing protein
MQLDDMMATEDQNFALILPADLFSDPDASDEIQVAVRLANGSPLPTWLSFDPIARTLSGRPANDHVGDIELVVEGKDHFGSAASTSFNITVQNTNDAPEVGASLTEQRALEDSAFSFTLPAGSFRDVDVGDALSYTAALQNGEALPDWLSFDAQTLTFTGTPANGDVRDLQVRVTATDLAGASANQVFALEVANTNDAPRAAIALADQQATEDADFSYVLPVGSFADADIGDRLSYWATLTSGEALPAWLQLDATTGSFSGRPGNSDVGALQIRVTATDLMGASASQSFNIGVANTNNAPQAVSAFADQHASEDTAFSFSVTQDAFRDIDVGDVLTLSASRADGSALPGWLSFDAASKTFHGLPNNDDVGNLSLRLTATDLAGAQASQTFGLGVHNLNDAPETGAVLAEQSARVGQALAWQMPERAFFDVDVADVLTLSAQLVGSSALPAWLNFEPASGRFSGTPTAAGRYEIQVTATDKAGASVQQSFAIGVAASVSEVPRNLAPIAVNDSAEVTEDSKLLAYGNLLANDSDPEGLALRIAEPGTRRGEYGVFTLLANGTYAYVLDDDAAKVQSLGAGQTVVDRFSYQASDGVLPGAGELAVSIRGNNDAPTLLRSLQDVALAKGRSFNWRMPANSFADPDSNDALSYTATLKNGKPLPSWLTFNSVTQTFSGTAPNKGNTSIDVKIVASDGHGAGSTASDSFTVSVGNKTVLPTTPTSNQGYGYGYGQDAAPPGYSNNCNSSNNGNNASPNNSNRQPNTSRNDELLEHFFEGFRDNAKSSQPRIPALDRNWFAKWDAEQQSLSEPGKSAANNDVQRHWSNLAQALSRLDAEREGLPAWCHPSQGADLIGLNSLAQGGTQAAGGGVDSLSLACGSGTQLKTFSGLSEGVAKLPC